MKVKSLSRVRLLETPWTTAYQAPLSMGFARQEYWSGLPLPSPYLSIEYPLNCFLSQNDQSEPGNLAHKQETPTGKLSL